MLGATSSNTMSAGMVAIAPSAGNARNSACAPNLSSLKPNTRLPTANDETASPTVSISPANSQPRIGAFGLVSPLKNRTIQGLAAR